MSHQQMDWVKRHYDWIQIIKQWIPKKNGLSLEVGCGDCRARYFIESFGWKWIGLDLAYSGDLSVLGDAHTLPFREKTFGMVVSFSAMEHFENPWEVLKEMSRILKSEGIFIGTCAFIEPHPDSYFHFSRMGLKKILNECGFVLKEAKPGWHILEVIVANFLPSAHSKFGFRLARLLAELHFKLGLIYKKSQIKDADQRRKLDKITKSDYFFMFAGSIAFKAQKME